MSAADIARLSTKIIQDFPNYYHYFSEKEFAFNNIKQRNKNTLLHTDGVDGLKTGHTDAGKYGIVVSAFKNGRRLVAVVNGIHNKKERAIEARKLLQHGFLNFTNIEVSRDDNSLGDIHVFLGNVEKVRFGPKKPIKFTVPITHRKQNKVTLKYSSVLSAPIDKNKKVGEVNIKLYDGRKYNFDLYPIREVKQLGFFKRMFVKAKTCLQTFSFSAPKDEEKTKSFMM